MNCAQGHVNAPGQSFCTTCGEALHPPGAAAEPQADPYNPAATTPPVSGGYAQPAPHAYGQQPSAPYGYGQPPYPQPGVPMGGAPVAQPPVYQYGAQPTHPGWAGQAATPPPPPSGGGRRNGLYIVGVVLLAVVAVGIVAANQGSKNGGGSTPSSSGSSQASASTGTTTVTALFEFTGESGSCYGSGGYSDIGPGTQAIVTDQNGEILGTSSLGAGTSGTTACVFELSFSSIPTDRSFYSFEVGRRGKITQSRSEMESAGWRFEVNLGS